MSTNTPKRKHFERKPIASRKEWVYLTILIFLAIATGTYLFYLVNNPYQKKNNDNADNNTIIVENTDDNKNEDGGITAHEIKPFPFEEKQHIIKDTTDSKYLTTEAYYYFIHKILVTHEDEIEKSTDLSLNWQDLVKMETRDNIRGKIMKLKGALVEDPKRELLKGSYAQERGIENLVVWSGAISSIDGRLYLFTTTELNKDAKRGDPVELNGIFYKIWIYENRGGLESKHPYFIGKKINVLEQVEATQHKKMTIVFLIFFAIVCILLGYGILNERQEANKFWTEYSQRRVKRLKKKNSSKEDKKEEAPKEEKAQLAEKEEAVGNELEKENET